MKNKHASVMVLVHDTLSKCVSFHRNISNGYQVIERTFSDKGPFMSASGQTDARGKTICLPTLSGGGEGGGET